MIESRSKSLPTSALAAILADVRRPGDFFASGTMATPLPQVEIDGLGPVSFPLLEVQARQIAAVAERAPYGRGEATEVDLAVRKTWQIGSEAFCAVAVRNALR